LRHYPTRRDGVDDALRLSAAMTDKCSLAGIDHGGGKTVAVLPAGSASATHMSQQCCATAVFGDRHGTRMRPGIRGGAVRLSPTHHDIRQVGRC
jgi:hypothetical protein